MASRTADALIHVDTVIEVNKIGKIVDARPLNRGPGSEAGTDGLQHLRIGPELRMATHAGFGRRKSGEGGSFYRGVAITAIDAIVGNMMFMAERDGLSGRYAHCGCKGTGVQTVGYPDN